MARFGEVDQSLDRAADPTAGSCSLAENEESSLQLGAAKNASERQRFLVNSLGKSHSPSTDILKDIVVKFFDSSKDLIEAPFCEDPQSASARLQDIAEAKFHNPWELAKFEDNMRKFELRVAEGKLPAHEVAATYRQVERLLNAADNPAIPGVTADVRRRLAQEIMEQSAVPTSINQGHHDTCSVTTIEARTYTRNPSAAAQLVTDIATTGVYKTAGHPAVEVHVDLSRIAPDQTSDLAVDEARSRASQIFQVTSVNIHYTMENNSIYPPGKVVYEQVKPEAGAIPPDDGERLWDRSTDPPTEISRDPEIPDDGLVRISNQITGQNETDILITHIDDFAGDGKLITKIESETSFQHTIERLHRDGKLPVILRVGSGNEPFLTDSEGGAAGGSGGPHFVTITGYRPGPPAVVEVDNQWGPEADHLGDQALTVHDLYLATRDSKDAGTIADVEKDVEAGRKDNKIDTFKEIELLRLKRAATIAELNEAKSDGTMTKDELQEANRKSAEEFDAGLARQIDAAAKRWAKGGELYEGEREKAVEKLDSILKATPPERRFAMLEKIHHSHLFSQEEYEQRVATAVTDARERWAAEDARAAEELGSDEDALMRRQAKRALATADMERLLKDMPSQRRKAVALR